MDFREVIARIPLFDILTEVERKALVESVQEEEINSGSSLYHQTCNKIFFIASGMVKVQVTNTSGRKVVLYLYNSGEFCTDVFSFLSGKSSQYNFIAVQPCKLMTITKQNMDFICDSHYGILKCRGVWLENFCMKLISELEKFYFMTPEQRYEELLNKKPFLFQALPNKDIASMIGITPESFSRMLSKAARKGKQH